MIKQIVEVQKISVTFNLAVADVKALNRFRRKWFRRSKGVKIATLAEIVLKHALCDPDAIDRSIGKFVHYRDAEGFTDGGDCMALLDSMVADRPEYRRARATV
jgi:hypothetical protein